MATYYGSSPMDLIEIQRFFFKAMDLFEHKRELTRIQRARLTALWIWRIAMFTGTFLQDIALFTAAMPETKARRIFTAFATMKIIIKFIEFSVQKSEITQMWHRLSNHAFKTETIGEMK